MALIILLLAAMLLPKAFETMKARQQEGALPDATTWPNDLAEPPAAEATPPTYESIIRAAEEAGLQETPKLEGWAVIEPASTTDPLPTAEGDPDMTWDDGQPVTPPKKD